MVNIDGYSISMVTIWLHCSIEIKAIRFFNGNQSWSIRRNTVENDGNMLVKWFLHDGSMVVIDDGYRWRSG